MATHRVLVTDKLAEEGLAQLRAEPAIEVVVDTKLAQDPAALRQALHGGRRDRDPVGHATDGRGSGRSVAVEGDRARGRGGR